MNRTCGDCTACCKLIPVESLNKPAGKRCKHALFRRGCAIYHKAGFPDECRKWYCRWLANVDTADLSRPDRSHYVIDIIPDYVTHQVAGKPDYIQPVLQIWVDPGYPDAHRDPALRAYLERRGAGGWAAIVRFNSSDALFLVPPQLSDKGVFEELPFSGTRTGRWSAEEVYGKLASAGMYPP